MAGSYDYRLVAVSVLVAILASYSALDLGARVTASQGRVRLWWMIGGAWSMGIAIWSMHFVGMLAFRLPVPVRYDWPTVLLSLLAAIFGSVVALFVVSRSTLGFLDALAGAILQGGSIVALHYIAMASMRLPAHMHYSPALTTLSVVLAIGGSLISLWLTFYFRDDPSGRILRRVAERSADGGWHREHALHRYGRGQFLALYPGAGAISQCGHRIPRNCWLSRRRPNGSPSYTAGLARGQA